MGDNGTCFQILLKDCGESDEPILTTAISCSERFSVFPVNVDTVVVIVVYEGGKLKAAVSGIES